MERRRNSARVLIGLVLSIVSLLIPPIDSSSPSTSYGPFYGNRDLLCNRGTRFSCYCSTVTWRRFSRTDAPICSQLFPNFESTVLELATCDVRLETNPLGGGGGSQDEFEDPSSATTFERYFKRTLAALIRRECQYAMNTQRCSAIPSDLDEEHIVFTRYECAKDLRTSRLWMVVRTRPGDRGGGQETDAQDESQFIDGATIARVLTSASVLPQLNSHLVAKNSHIVNIQHSRPGSVAAGQTAAAEKGGGGDDRSMVIVDPEVDGDNDIYQHEDDEQRQERIRVTQTEYDPRQQPDDGEDDQGGRQSAVDGGAATTDPREVNPHDQYKFNWVSALIGSIFLLYFIVVWIIAFVFCMKKRKDIHAKNRRLRGEEPPGGIGDEKQPGKKLMSRDEDSDYDNN